MPPKAKTLKELANTVELEALFQRSGKFSLVNAIATDEALWTPPVAHLAMNIEEDGVNYDVTLEATATHPELEVTIFEIKGSWKVAYGLDDTGAFDEDTYRALGATTAIFNVWPHWREYVMSAANRMQAPFPVLPPLLHVTGGGDLVLRMLWDQLPEDSDPNTESGTEEVSES